MAAIRYCISNLRSCGGAEPFLRHIERLAQSRSIDFLQIREKDLPARETFDLTRRAAAIVRPHGVKILVNERADVALAAGADGVHLPGRSLSPALIRQAGLRWIGVSCHDAAELAAAEAEGADFAVLGPVFAPLSKTVPDPPLGLGRFSELVRGVRMPVLALGGVTAENTAACLAAGAAGVAGITLFSGASMRPSTETAEHPEPR